MQQLKCDSALRGHFIAIALVVVTSCVMSCLQDRLRAAEPAFGGGLNLVLRDRVPSPVDSERFERRERTQRWDARKTAIIVCDMWDLHHCKRAVERVQEMAPRMNDVLNKARSQGVLIIHAPSSCMSPYENTPMRQRAKNAPRAKNLPNDIGQWC